MFSEYVTVNSLASYHIDTPDPLLNNPPVGQRLFISWDLPKTYGCYEDLHMELFIRFRNREQDSLNIKLCNLSGTYVYGLYNDDFFKKDGILTYKILLMGGGEVLDEWRHQIWVDMISFPEEAPSLYDENDDFDDDWIQDPDQKIEFI